MKWAEAVEGTEVKTRDITRSLEQLAGSAMALQTCIEDGGYELEPLIAEVSRMRGPAQRRVERLLRGGADADHRTGDPMILGPCFLLAASRHTPVATAGR